MEYHFVPGYLESDLHIVGLLLAVILLIAVANVLFLRYARHLTTSSSFPENREQNDEVLRSHAQDMNEYEMICIKYGEKRLIDIVLQRLQKKGFVKTITVEN
jgi:hypothetical protein